MEKTKQAIIRLGTSAELPRGSRRTTLSRPLMPLQTSTWGEAKGAEAEAEAEAEERTFSLLIIVIVIILSNLSKLFFFFLDLLFIAWMNFKARFESKIALSVLLFFFFLDKILSFRSVVIVWGNFAYGSSFCCLFLYSGLCLCLVSRH